MKKVIATVVIIMVCLTTQSMTDDSLTISMSNGYAEEVETKELEAEDILLADFYSKFECEQKCEETNTICGMGCIMGGLSEEYEQCRKKCEYECNKCKSECR